MVPTCYNADDDDNRRETRVVIRAHIMYEMLFILFFPHFIAVRASTPAYIGTSGYGTHIYAPMDGDDDLDDYDNWVISTDVDVTRT